MGFFKKTYTYIINIIGPISVIGSQLISYNKYPIICISNHGLEQVWDNPDIISSINNTISDMGEDLIDKSSIHVRILDDKANINDFEIPLKEILEIWNH